VADVGPMIDGTLVDAPPAPGCSSGKSPVEDATCIKNGSVVFVSASAMAMGDGTKEKPYGKLSEALAKSGTKPIVLCQGMYAEATTLTFTQNASVYGGFACDSWAHNATNATTVSVGKSIGAKVTASTKVRLGHLTLTSSEATEPGGSSIGIVNQGGELTLQSATIKSGKGMAGKSGANGTTGESGMGGGAPSPLPGPSTGGGGGSKVCDTVLGQVTTQGGKGGDARIVGTAAGSGASGTPMTNLMDTTPGFTGLGGKGYDEVNGTQAVSGSAGANGAPGPAAGAAGVSSKWNGASSVWQGPAGSKGDTGFPGQGGGGGGGGNLNQSGGGGGGSGGCGGTGGLGGEAGGASLGVVSETGKVTITASKIVVDLAGQGGIGGGGGGGGGGVGGAVGSAAGNEGGNGAGGNGGGGGEGGLRAAVLLVGSVALTVDGAVVSGATETAAWAELAGAAALGGTGGEPGKGFDNVAHPGNAGKSGSPGNAGKKMAVAVNP
jgi:hypothetical protein